jgi:hypothetical protein
MHTYFACLSQGDVSRRCCREMLVESIAQQDGEWTAKQTQAISTNDGSDHGASGGDGSSDSNKSGGERQQTAVPFDRSWH